MAAGVTVTGTSGPGPLRNGVARFMRRVPRSVVPGRRGPVAGVRNQLDNMSSGWFASWVWRFGAGQPGGLTTASMSAYATSWRGTGSRCAGPGASPAERWLLNSACYGCGGCIRDHRGVPCDEAVWKAGRGKAAPPVW